MAPSVLQQCTSSLIAAYNLAEFSKSSKWAQSVTSEWIVANSLHSYTPCENGSISRIIVHMCETRRNINFPHSTIVMTLILYSHSKFYQLHRKTMEIRSTNLEPATQIQLIRRKRTFMVFEKSRRQKQPSFTMEAVCRRISSPKIPQRQQFRLLHIKENFSFW